MVLINKMKDIGIYGAGGFGREVACLINLINEKKPTWNLLGFFDDNLKLKGKDSKYGKILGDIEILNRWENELDLAIAIGKPSSLQNIIHRISNPLISYPNIIAPDFGFSDKESFTIGQGNIIGFGCAASCDVTIGNYNILNADIVMGHDVAIGDFNVIMPDIRISGEVTIGNNNLLGVGSIILQQINIGDNVHLGAGAVLMTKPKNGGTYIGNPAKLFKY